MKRLITLTGSTCAGKSTLEARIVAEGAQRAISTTTRPPRFGERDGMDYYFVSEKTFQVSRFVEQVQFGEHHYGLTVVELDHLFERGDTVVLVCEPTGAKQIRQYCAHHEGIELTQVFVDNPQQVIIQRFLKRFADELASAKATCSPAAVNRVFDTQSKRMLMMNGIEKTWIAQAYGDAHPGRRPLHAIDHLAFKYDMLVEHCNGSNLNEIATSIMLQKVPETA